MEKPRAIPWTPLAKPLSECTVTLISSAGIALKSDRPFDQEGERQNPWWGDPSYRILPKTATSQDEVRLYHMHIDPSYAEQDFELPVPVGDACKRLEDSRRDRPVGAPALLHRWATSCEPEQSS